jgi:hypothetical protein
LLHGAKLLGFIQNSSLINDLKLRAAYSITGNMFSGAYLTSKETLTGRRVNGAEVPVKDYITNKDLSVEKKGTINAGLDVAMSKKAVNLHVDYYHSMVNNLMINQSLPVTLGFTDYIDNGGKLAIDGIELGLDGRMYLWESILTLNASVTYQKAK